MSSDGPISMGQAAKLLEFERAKARPEPGDPEPFPGQVYSDIKPEEWSWLWTGRVPIGGITFLEGYAGDGKSSVCADVVARVSNGSGLPGDEGMEPAGALWFTTEESPSKTIVKRLQLAHARMENIVNIDTTKERGSFRFPSGEKRLASSVKVYAKRLGKPIRLLVIDGVFSTFDKGLDPNSAIDVREHLGAVQHVAEQHNLSVLIIRHPSKARGGLAQHRAGGSTAWGDFVRMAWLVGVEPGTNFREYRRVLVGAKQNAGRAYPGIKFHTEWNEKAGEVRVLWDDICEYTADEVYAAREQQNQAKATPEQIQEAVDVLRTSPQEITSLQGAKAALRGSGLPQDAIYNGFRKLNDERKKLARYGRREEAE